MSYRQRQTNDYTTENEPALDEGKQHQIQAGKYERFDG